MRIGNLNPLFFCRELYPCTIERSIVRVFREIFALGGIFRLPHRLQTALLDAIDPLRASAIRAGARGGARAGKHRCVRILAITAGSSMAAMILKSPPHCGQCSRSIPKTRLSRRAQFMRADACACSSACSLGFSAAPGTSAARRCMNSSGDILMCVVPSRQALLSCSTTSPAPQRTPACRHEAMRIGAQRRRGFLVPTRYGSQAQHLLSGARPQRDAIGARGRLQ